MNVKRGKTTHDQLRADVVPLFNGRDANAANAVIIVAVITAVIIVTPVFQKRWQHGATDFECCAEVNRLCA